jgi:hypothetical protein
MGKEKGKLSANQIWLLANHMIYSPLKLTKKVRVKPETNISWNYNDKNII